jgi:tetratricopeptide (TPR) repeat protein
MGTWALVVFSIVFLLSPNPAGGPTVVTGAEYYRLNGAADRAFSAAKLDEAVGLYERLASTNPGSGDIWLKLAKCYERLGQFPKAAEAYERALDLAAGNRAYFEYQSAKMWGRAGDRLKALGWLKRANADGFEDRFGSLSDGPTPFLNTLHQAQEASQAKQWTKAVVLWEEVTKQNPVTGDFWLQLASARYSAQDCRGAIAAYNKAMEVGVDGLPSAIPYDVARCYVRLGELDMALQWFEKAMRLGYRDLQNAQHDPDLQPLRNNPKFRELVGLVDPSKMSRAEGWRYDLTLMAREIERRGYAPFHLISREEFERRVATLNEAIPKLTDMQIIVEMLRLTAAVGDGHTMIYAFFERPDFFRNLPVEFAYFQEGLFIVAADSRFTDLLGAQVVRFADRSEQEVLQSLDSLVSRDNTAAPKVMGPMRMRNLPLLAALGLIPDATQVSLSVRDLSGNLRTVRLPADSEIPSRKLWDGLPKNWVRFVDTIPGPLPLSLKDPYKDYWYQYLPESKMVYLQWNHVHSDPADPIAYFFDHVSQFIQDHPVEKLVLDMRWNNGGDTGLVPVVLSSLIRDVKVDQPGKLFVITGHRTFSAAQNAVTMITRLTAAIVVGDTTGSSPNFIGEDAALELPYSKLMLSISDLYWESSWPTDHRTWIPPLLYTPPRFAEYRENRDGAMDAILEYRGRAN